MSCKVDNAIIMAAGTSSRFAPLSYEKPKALIEVRGQILIERQIKQLLEAGITNIYVVTGYKAEMFDYLATKYGVKLVHNSEYLTRNNNSSIWSVKSILGNSYICSADNYFMNNPFKLEEEEAYYAAEYADEYIDEWCMQEDYEGYISNVVIGGENSWYMIGHAFWSEKFSRNFLEILKNEYKYPATADKLWEKIYIEHLDKLKMKIQKYPPKMIFEFDSLDELRAFDTSYICNTRSEIIKAIALRLHVDESCIINIKAIKGKSTEADGFTFNCEDINYRFLYSSKELLKINELR